MSMTQHAFPKLKFRSRVRATLCDVPPPPKIVRFLTLPLHEIFLVHFVIKATLGDTGLWTRCPLQNERLDLELQQHLE